MGVMLMCAVCVRVLGVVMVIVVAVTMMLVIMRPMVERRSVTMLALCCAPTLRQQENSHPENEESGYETQYGK